jgi:hypothetical protein
VDVVSSVALAKARYVKARDDARREAALRLEPKIGVPFYLSGWTKKAQEAYLSQWPNERHKDAGWAWIEVFQRYRDMDRLDLVLWSGDRLAGLAIGNTTNVALKLDFIEGDPREDCPLTGHRALIFLEAGACYCQAVGLTELRVRPVNRALEGLYRDIYGFELATPVNEQSYFRREVE